MRVVYSGTIVSNGGDAAILAAQIELVRAGVPGHVAAVHDADPKTAASLFPGAEAVTPCSRALWTPRVPGRLSRYARRSSQGRMRLAARLTGRGSGAARRLASALLTPAERVPFRSLATADLVAYSGGTSLVEQYDLDPKLFELEIARLLGRPVILLPQSLGPFADARNQRRVRAVVADAARVLVRDQRSLDHLKDIGADTSSTHVVPDVVFSLTGERSLARLRHRESPDRPQIAVSVRDCRRFFEGSTAERDAQEDRYEQAVADLATYLVSTVGASVTFISTCQGLPGYWTDDSKVALRVAARMDSSAQDAVRVDRAYHGTNELIDRLGETDLVVSTRLHGAILALASGTPILPISYEFKTHEVMGQLGLGEFVTDIRGITAADLKKRYTALVQALPQLRGPLSGRLAAVVADSRKTSDHVRAILRRRPRDHHGAWPRRNAT